MTYRVHGCFGGDVLSTRPENAEETKREDVGFDTLFRWFLPEDDAIFRHISAKANQIELCLRPHSLRPSRTTRGGGAKVQMPENGYGVRDSMAETVGQVAGPTQVVPVTKINERRSIVCYHLQFVGISANSNAAVPFSSSSSNNWRHATTAQSRQRLPSSSPFIGQKISHVPSILNNSSLSLLNCLKCTP